MQKCIVTELIDELEAEVNNGGFHQYFSNSSGNNAEMALSSLEAVGAEKMATILRKAIAKFPSGIVPEDRDEREKMLDEIAPDCIGFEELDSEFCQYPDDLAALVEDYAGS